LSVSCFHPPCFVWTALAGDDRCRHAEFVVLRRDHFALTELAVDEHVELREGQSVVRVTALTGPAGLGRYGISQSHFGVQCGTSSPGKSSEIREVQRLIALTLRPRADRRAAEPTTRAVTGTWTRRQTGPVATRCQVAATVRHASAYRRGGSTGQGRPIQYEGECVSRAKMSRQLGRETCSPRPPRRRRVQASRLPSVYGPSPLPPRPRETIATRDAPCSRACASFQAPSLGGRDRREWQ
jgi:hypothetical protein